MFLSRYQSQWKGDSDMRDFIPVVIIGVWAALGIHGLAQQTIAPIWPDEPGYGGSVYTILSADQTNMDVQADADITGVDWARDTSASNAFLFFRIWVRDQKVSQLTSIGHSVFLDLDGDNVLDYALYNTTKGASESELAFWNTGTVPDQWDALTSPPSHLYLGGTRDYSSTDQFIELAVPTSDLGVVPDEVLAYSYGNGALDLDGQTNNAPPGTFLDDEVAVSLSVEKMFYGTSETGLVDSVGSDVQVGETTTWQIDITMSQGTVSNLTVTDYMPEGLGFVCSSVVIDTNTFAGTLGMLEVSPTGTTYAASGEDVVIYFADSSTVPTGVEVSNQTFSILLDTVVWDTNGVSGLPPDASILTNTASVTYSNNPADPATSSVVNVSVVEPETTTMMEDSTASNSVVVYHWSITNSGTATAFEPEWKAVFDSVYWSSNGLGAVAPTGFVVVVTNSAGDPVVRVEPDPASSPPETTIEVGQTLDMTVTAVLRPAVPSPIPMQAMMEQYTTLEGSNLYERVKSSSVSNVWIDYDQAVDLAVTDAVSPTAAYEGDPVAYTVSVTNSGPDEAVDLEIDATLASALEAGVATPSSGTYSNGTWSIPSLPFGQAATLTLNASVKTGLTSSVISHSATVVTNRPADVGPGNNSDSALLDVLLRFAIKGIEPDGAGHVVITWEGRDGFSYGLERGTNLLVALATRTNGVAGVSPMNVHTDTVPHPGPWLYRVFQE